MFIRTIKMINERGDETIRKLLNLSGHSAAGAKRAQFGGAAAAGQVEAAPLRLEPMIEFLADKQSSLEADAKVCQLIESGVHAIVGPTEGASIQHVQSICDNMEIPYFELRPFLGSPATPPAWSPFPSTPSAPPPPPPPPPSASLGFKRAERNQSHPAAAASELRRGSAVEDSRGQQDWREPYAEQSHSPGNKLEDLTLNLFPPAHLLNSAYIDLIYSWNWSSFAIVYEQSSSMIKLQDLFRESSGSWTSKWQIKLFQFRPPEMESQTDLGASRAGGSPLHAAQAPSSAEQSNQSGGNNSKLAEQIVARNSSGTGKQTDTWQAKQGSAKSRGGSHTFRDIFWKIKLSGEQNILLDVDTKRLSEALKQAQQVGCMTERFSYLVTSLDLHTIDLEDFKYSRTRITALSMIQVSRSSKAKTSDGQGNDTKPLKDKQRLHLDEAPLDEKYVERLGIHVIQASEEQLKQSEGGRTNHAHRQHASSGNNQRPIKYELSPSVVLDRTGNFMDPPNEVYRDWSRREMLASSPASMSLLPSVDRDNEQRLFEFLINQQERDLSRVRMSTSSAILHDSLLLYLLGLNELDPKGNFLGQQQSIACSPDSSPWLHGSSLVNYMRRSTFTGLTGPVSFDQQGLRTDFKLDVMGMAPDVGMVKVGEWHSGQAGLEVGGGNKWQQLRENEQPDESNEFIQGRSYDELSEFYDLELKRYNRMLSLGERVSVPYTKRMNSENQAAGLRVNGILFERLYKEQADQVDTLIVTTKLSQPYFMLKETPNKLEGNDQYEGFAVDLIHELSKLVNFRYRWREVADKKYGSKEVLPNGTMVWNGMIGEIVRGQADLAIVDLTITAQREEAVDFTLPFMSTGISILFKKPTTKVTTLFSFLSPFSSDVWAYVLAAYCGISAILFLVGHLSPYEWANPHPCKHMMDDDETVLKNQFSLLNSFWFTIGSLMQQGSDLTPRSMSTRTIAGIWYFFTLIMISSYTANLAAFLTVEKVVYPIENVRDLSNQNEIKYGCVESGSTCTFFHDSQIDTYKRINETMRRFKTYVRSNDEGQKRVEEGKFAFFMESASIEYIVERNCNLTQIGGLLDSKGYGLATSKRSRLKRPYRTLLSEGILHLQETGMLHILKNRWWKERRGGGTCTDDGKGGGVTELSLANVGGVFVVLLGGLGISFLVAIAEFMWRAKRSGSSRDRMCEEMMRDLKFALACKRSTKPMSKTLNGSNKLQSKQLRRQQSSLLSQSEPAEATGAGAPMQAGQDCDPLLLQAMLSMLAQQQQQQQLLLNHQLSRLDKGAAAERADPSSHFRHLDPYLLDGGQLPLGGGSNELGRDSSLEARGAPAALFDVDGNQSSRTDGQAGHLCATWNEASAAGRRRQLFAQRTIDIADESFNFQFGDEHH